MTLMCRVLEVSKSGYYAWRKRPPSTRAQENEQLAAKIAEIHAESRKSYGSPRVHAELVVQGFEVDRNRVARLMRENGIVGRRKPTRNAHDPTGLEQRGCRGLVERARLVLAGS